MEKLLFGTGGAPLSTTGSGSEAGIKRIRELGLSCMEIEWVQSSPSAKESKTLSGIREEAEKEPKIVLSCHASYYINLAGEPEVIGASRDRIQRSAKALSIAGGRNVVFHPAFYKGMTSEQTLGIVVENLLKVTKWLEENTVKGVCLRPETTGKPTQFGSLEEIIKICLEVPNTLPCVDFAHLHARTGGKNNSYKEFAETLEMVGKNLGDNALKDIHIHMSGIEYSDKGERKHLKLDESDMNYKELMKALKDYNVAGTVICESPVLEEDALIMKARYESL